MRLPAVLAVVLAGACSGGHEAAGVPGTDPVVDPLLTDLLDAKVDAAGHPFGARVLDAVEGCMPETGAAGPEGWQALPDQDRPGTLCTGTLQLPRGRHTVSLRMLGLDAPECQAEECTDVAVTVQVQSGEAELASWEVPAAELGEPMVYRDHAHTLELDAPYEVSLLVTWPGQVPVRLRYVEVFRPGRQLILEPRSGVGTPDDVFRIEVVDPPEEASLKLRCNDEDLTDRLQELLDGGEVTDERTDFRRIVSVPAESLLGGCEGDRHVVVSLVRSGWPMETSEVYLDTEPVPCAFEDTDRVRVLLTGFVPFPAGAHEVNSSALAVESFEASDLPDASVMHLILPVEHDSAARIVQDVVTRCEPDIVIGFGQGRYRVDLETTAYNERGHADVPGGVPDNRGAAYGGEPFEPDGPATLPTRLPVEPILAHLASEGVDAGPSDDPGRYVCNDLFYHLASDGDPQRMTGFVHLPRIFNPTDADRRLLATTVHAVVSEALAARPDDGG